MTEKKFNLFRYVAGAIFIVQIISFLISGSIGGSNLLKIIANAIMAGTLLTKKDKLFALGIGASILHIIGSIIEYTRFIISATGISIALPTIWAYSMAVNDTFVFAEAIRCVVFVLILVAVIKSDKCQKLSYIAIALLFATDILPEIIECGFSHLFIGLLSGLLSAIFCSLPMALSIIAIHNNSNSQPIIARKATAPVFTTTEKLTKLKNLLDMGVITQEEFDAKKKELLNL